MKYKMDSIEIDKGGYIYIILNPSMPGLLKIGKSRENPETKATELSRTTGVQNSFFVAYFVTVSDIHTAEFEIHRYLNDFKDFLNRDFFRMPLNQAIDLVKKIISNLLLETSNCEVGTYKFRFKEFSSAKSLFGQILENEENWEQAKLHLEKGYLQEWLKKKDEFDTLIVIDKYSNGSVPQNLDYLLSLIAFSIIEGDFQLYTINLKSIADLNKEIFINEAKIKKLFLSNKIYYIYKGYLNSRNINEDKFYLWLEFFNDLEYETSEEKWENSKKVIDWATNSKKYLHLESINQEKIKFLLTYDEFNIKTKYYPFPVNLTINNRFLSDEKITMETIDFIDQIEKIFFELGCDLKSPETVKGFLLESYFPNEALLNESSILEDDVFLLFFKHLIEKDKIIKINDSSILPDGLYKDLSEEEDFVIFSSAIYIFYYFENFTKIHYGQTTLIEPLKYFENTNPKLFKKFEYFIAKKFINDPNLTSKEKLWFDPLSLNKFVNFGRKDNYYDYGNIFISKSFFDKKRDDVKSFLFLQKRGNINLLTSFEFFELYEEYEEQNKRFNNMVFRNILN